jgi:hypothetical protein
MDFVETEQELANIIHKHVQKAASEKASKFEGACQVNGSNNTVTINLCCERAWDLLMQAMTPANAANGGKE